MNYDLENRTRVFSKNILCFCKKIKINYLNSNIISQLLRSSTSVGANYCEANNASSKNDFRNKIYLSRKEIQETEYWLDLLAEICEINDELQKLQKETRELILIFNKITFSLKN